MDSGVKCTDECLTKYNELKLKKNCRYILYKIEDGAIVVDKIGDRSCTFDDFKKELECLDRCGRYAVLDFEPCSNRVPDSASIRERMLYASSIDALKSQLTGFKSHVQVNEKADLVEEYFREAIPGYHK